MRELLNIAWPDFITFVFIFIRVGIIFASVPVFSAEIVPRTITALIAFFLSLVLMPVIPPLTVAMSDISVFFLLVLMLHELLIGLCLGLAVSLIFAGIQIAGQLAGFQMGFAIANVVDPMTGADAPITANMFYIVALLLFLSFGGHHLLIKALVESFTMVPIESSLPHQGYMFALITYAATMFVVALKVVAPIIGVLLLLQVVFALTARAIPQMNVFLMSFPLIICVGLIFMIVVIKTMPFFFEAALQQAWEFMKTALSFF